jgi:hypothetical protein
MKNGRNKYRLDKRGELMLVHECIECGAVSINRIAADDDPSSIMEIFEGSITNPLHTTYQGRGILMLNSNDRNVLYKQLYGTPEVEFVG